MATSEAHRLDLGLQVEPALRRDRAAARPPPAAETRPPKMSSNIEKMSADVHVREVVLPGDAGVAELVVALPLAVVGEDLVRLGALLELGSRLGLVLRGCGPGGTSSPAGGRSA